MIILCTVLILVADFIILVEHENCTWLATNIGTETLGSYSLHVIGWCCCRTKLSGNKTSKIPIPVSVSKSPRSSVVETLTHTPRYPALLYPHPRFCSASTTHRPPFFIFFLLFNARLSLTSLALYRSTNWISRENGRPGSLLW